MSEHTPWELELLESSTDKPITIGAWTDAWSQDIADDAYDAWLDRAAIDADALCPDCENWKIPGTVCYYCEGEYR